MEAALKNQIETFSFKKEYNLFDYTFIHAGEPIVEETFKKPDIRFIDAYCIWYDCFFSSKKIGDSSHWLEHCKEGGSYYDKWLEREKQYYKVRPNAKIYILSHENLTKDYETLFDLREYNYRESFYQKFIKDHNELMKSIIAYSQHLDEFKYKYNKDDDEKIRNTMKKFSVKSFPDNGPITKSHQMTFKYWCYNLKKLISLYDRLKNISKIERENNKYGEHRFILEKIYEKGYDGFYIPQDVIDNKHIYVGKYNTIQRILGHYGADTLMIWNWCLNKIDL